MISICTCSIDAKFDAEMFVRATHFHNPDVDFEIVLVHDDRVDDGSGEHFAKLAEEYPRLKVVKHTHEDVKAWLTKLAEHYRNNNIFESEFREKLITNFERYDELAGQSGFVWISSGPLYNKAIQAANGDLIIVTPSDFFYLFPLKRLMEFIDSNSPEGFFYSSPHAAFVNVSNQDLEWGRQAIQDPSSHHSIRRDYFSCPSLVEQLWIADLTQQEVIEFTDPKFFEKVKDLLDKRHGFRYIHGFHGFHVMTRKLYDEVGGFTEDFFDRAYADDKMTFWGNACFGQRWSAPFPYEFSVAWCPNSKLYPLDSPPYPSDWKERLEKKDPFWREFLHSGMRSPVYLYKGLCSGEEFLKNRRQFFDITTPPVKL